MRPQAAGAILLIALLLPSRADQWITRPPALPNVQWTAMPVRSAHQAALGMRGGEGGQCIHGIARSPSDDRRIYLAVDVVGVWRSRDAGRSWQPARNAGLYGIGTTSIDVHPRDPDRLLVYLDAAWEKAREPEEGLYYSVDAGETWTRVLAVPNNDTRRGYRHLIDFARDGRRAFFAAHDAGIYRSDNGGVDWHGSLNLQGIAAWEVRTDPRDPDLLYAATEEGLFVSSDAAKTFHRIDFFADAPVSSVSLDPSKPGRIYVIKPGDGLFRSDDNGANFHRLPTGDRALDREARHLFQSPVDPRRIVVAADRRMRVTLDAGQSWRDPDIDFSRSYVQQGAWGFHEGIAWGTRDAGHAVALLSCGAYASTDSALNWHDSGAGYTGFHHGWSDGAVSFLPGDPNTFAFFCYDYAFTWTADAGRTFRSSRPEQKIRDWYGMYVGDLHPNWKSTPTVIAAAGNYWKNQIVRSDDAGRSWNLIDDTDGAYFFIRFHPKDPRIIYADDRRSDDAGRTFKKLDKPVYAFAPSRPDTVYGHADGKLWRSDDRGDTWRALPDAPLPVREQMGRRDIEVDPRDENRAWVLTPPDCAVFDGAKWRSVEASKWAPPRAHPFVSRMAIDPSRPDRIILGLDAHGVGYLFLSDDAGQTWSDITANLPRLGSNQSLNIQPSTGRIFIGAGFGTWTTQIPHP